MDNMGISTYTIISINNERRKIMLVTFNYSIIFGKGDGADSCVEMEITQEEYDKKKDELLNS